MRYVMCYKCYTVSRWPSLLDPVREVADEVEEEISLRNADHLVRNLHKQTEALTRPQIQSLCYILTEVLGPGGRVHFKRLQVVRFRI